MSSIGPRVGFLGAGLILQETPKKSAVPKVRGLTTAASIWIAAALGAAIGCGLWQMALLGGLLTLITLSGVKQINRSVLVQMKQSEQVETEHSPSTSEVRSLKLWLNSNF